ncbi:tetratricopeptide repeat protein [Desulfonatronovibrio magnus]|uniref:tetratricopeptide repeat protein n=1 Tax=Desulfonatronovibrio magnus TaxID=698827 RepID=UPI0005EB1E28|nr:tetratricopeptide repeat protein [Desulfonatronovibrio magnus]
MRKYKVYHHPSQGLVAVKDGFCWPAFLLSILWMAFKKLWFHVLAWAYWIFLTVFLYGEFSDKLADSFVFYGAAAVFFMVFFLIPGISGHKWLQVKTKKQGFEYLDSVAAANASAAVNAVSQKKLKWTIADYTDPDESSMQDEQLSKPVRFTQNKASEKPGNSLRYGVLILLFLSLGAVWWFLNPSIFSTEDNGLDEQVQKTEQADDINDHASQEATTASSKKSAQDQDLTEKTDMGTISERPGEHSSENDEVLQTDIDYAARCNQDFLTEDWKRAKESCHNAVQEKPEDAQLWNRLGQVYMQTDQAHQAEQAYEQAAGINPESVQAWSGKADALLMQDKSEQAVQALSQVVSLDPENMQARARLADEYTRTGQSHKAIDVWNQAENIQPGSGIQGLQDITRIQPQNPKAWHELGNAYDNVQDSGGAARAYQKAVDIDSGRADTWENLGNAQMAMGDFKQAISSYETATSINPSLSKSWYGQGRAYLSSENFHEQAALVGAGQTHGFFHKELNVWHGFEMTGDDLLLRLKAVKAFNNAVAIDPGFAEAWYEMGSFFLSTGQWMKPAIVYLEKAVDMKPDYDQAWKTLSKAYDAVGRKSQSIDALEKVLKLQKYNPENWEALIKACQEHGLENRVKKLTREMKVYFEEE